MDYFVFIEILAIFLFLISYTQKRMVCMMIATASLLTVLYIISLAEFAVIDIFQIVIMVIMVLVAAGAAQEVD